MIIPGVQKPHWSPCFSQNAVWIGVEPAAGRHALDRRDRVAVGLDREDRARLDRPAVELDGARPALAGVAADVRPGQPEVLAQRLDEQPSGLDHHLSLDAVHRQRDLLSHHGEPPSEVRGEPDGASPGTGAGRER